MTWVNREASLVRRTLAPMIVVLMLAALVFPAQADIIKLKTELPEWFRQKLHTWQEYQILVIKGANPTAEVDKLVASPDAYRLAVWQEPLDRTRESDVRRVMQWVADGGILWFQDSRLGAMLGGFESAPIGGGSIPPQGFKLARGAYGEQGKVDGANMFGVANPGGGHPVLGGVDYVQLFTLKVGEEQTPDGKTMPVFSAIRRASDVIPLLRYDPTSGSPLSDRLAAGMKAHGEGFIVFKPLVWEELYTGGRFQYNLLEWSTGFGVPDMTTSGKSGRKPRRKAASAPAAPQAVSSAFDQVTLIDKQVLSGRVRSKELEVTTIEPLLSKTRISFDKIVDVTMQADGVRDAVTTADGRRSYGSVSFPGDLEFEMSSGQVRKLKKSELVRLVMHSPSTASDKKGK